MKIFETGLARSTRSVNSVPTDRTTSRTPPFLISYLSYFQANKMNSIVKGKMLFFFITKTHTKKNMLIMLITTFVLQDQPERCIFSLNLDIFTHDSPHSNLTPKFFSSHSKPSKISLFPPTSETREGIWGLLYQKK